MAMVYRPTVSGDGRIVETAQWNALMKRFRGDGVLTDDYGATSLQVSADGSGMQVTVAAGEAIMLGGLWASDADEPVIIEAADGTYDRIDLVVARFDRVTETASLEVLKGTPAATPAAEAPTQNAAVWELALAEVYVAAGVTSIGASDVTDRREFSVGLDEHLEDTSNPHQVTAEQVGAASEDAIDDRFRAPTPITSGSFDDYTDPGMRVLLRGDLTNAPPNAGSGTYWYILNFRYNDRVLQLALPYRAAYAKRVWYRTYYYSSGWTDWVQVWTSNDIQRITGDGECRRYPDGLQICWAVVSVDANTNYAWTYPAAFAAIPAVTGHAVRDPDFLVYYNVSTTKATWRSYDNGNGHNAYLTAIGRWK